MLSVLLYTVGMQLLTVGLALRRHDLVPRGADLVIYRPAHHPPAARRSASTETRWSGLAVPFVCRELRSAALRAKRVIKFLVSFRGHHQQLFNSDFFMLLH